MGITSDLEAEVAGVIKDVWDLKDGRVVPDTGDVALGNHGIALEATCLYADLAESTQLVKSLDHCMSAEVYKCFLNCACRLIRHQNGVVTAFDGDRVMAVFLGDSKNTSAVRAALAINHAVINIINPALTRYYKERLRGYVVKHGVGVDSSKLMIARAGIRGSNDLVWIGRAANFAAKLCALRGDGYATWITNTVFNNMNDSVKLASDGKSMWEARTWTAQDNMTIYRSNYHWGLG